MITYLPAHVEPQNVNDLMVTILDVFDDCSLTQVLSAPCAPAPPPQEVREETYKYYPHAKLGHLKEGGNFPYLSRSEEVNLYIAIHLRWVVPRTFTIRISLFVCKVVGC